MQQNDNQAHAHKRTENAHTDAWGFSASASGHFFKNGYLWQTGQKNGSEQPNENSEKKSHGQSSLVKDLQSSSPGLRVSTNFMINGRRFGKSFFALKTEDWVSF